MWWIIGGVVVVLLFVAVFVLAACRVSADCDNQEGHR